MDLSVGSRIGYEEAIDALDHATDLVSPNMESETRALLELAAGQTAIALAISGSEIPIVASLKDRVAVRQSEAIPSDIPELDKFCIEYLLTPEEAAFLPTARVIVGLTYQAARNNSSDYNHSHPFRPAP
jgi:hypothetical protein